MSERKVLNKYFPPDFDPSKIVRRKLGKDRQQVVRLMAPFSMRCSTCGEYIYKGKKFNARKETVNGEEYYGIKIFRFYIKCTQCSAEITFKTDPKNTDYLAEHGAVRNFEPWRDNTEAAEEDKLTRMEEEENNPMAALENKSIDSKREMDILDALQELKTRNARIERAGKLDSNDKRPIDLEEERFEKKVQVLVKKQKAEEEMDELEIAKIFGRSFVGGVPDIELEQNGSESDSSQSSQSSSSSSTNSTAGPSTTSIKRKLDKIEPTPAELLSINSKSILEKKGGVMGPPSKKKGKGKNDLANKLGIRLKK